MRNIIHLTLPWTRPAHLQLPRTASLGPEVAPHHEVFERATRLMQRHPDRANRHLNAFLDANPDQAPRVARFWREHRRPCEAVAVLDEALARDMIEVFESRGESRTEALQQSFCFRGAVAAEIYATLRR